jgi:hypothetical protein
MVEVIVSRLGLDAASQAFVIILEEKGGERTLPIWIGRAEAESIAAHLNDVKRERPLTHDLAQSLIGALGGLLRRVQVTRVHNGTFYGELHLTRGGQPVVVDSRPSDAIAIALRLAAPIFVHESLFEDAEEGGASDVPAAPTDSDSLSAEELKRHLAQLRPEDFGRFQP